MSVILLVKGHGGWIPIEKKGTVFQFAEAADSRVELFRIGVFAKAVGRTNEVIHDWHRAKVVPPACFEPEGEQCKKWYSASQLVNANRLFVHKYKGRKITGPDRELHSSFLADLKRVWYCRDVVIDEQGKDIIKKEKKAS
jgi:hypothetical protein